MDFIGGRVLPSLLDEKIVARQDGVATLHRRREALPAPTALMAAGAIAVAIENRIIDIEEQSLGASA